MEDSSVGMGADVIEIPTDETLPESDSRQLKGVWETMGRVEVVECANSELVIVWVKLAE